MIVQPEQAILDDERPWPGLASFREQDKEYFKGRETDIEKLLILIHRERLTVLFGISGLGKSSLLQAGLFPECRQENILPITIRLNFTQGSISLREQIFAAIAQQVKEQSIEAPHPIENETLWEYFHRRNSEFWDSRNRIVIPLLCFDQFEEIFTLAADDLKQNSNLTKFIMELADLVEGRCPEQVKARLDTNPDETKKFNFRQHPYKLIFSLREDYLAELEALRGHMPSVIHNRMRLLQMNGKQALAVVNQTEGRLIDSKVAETIVRQVAGKQESKSQELLALRIEPALLSLVCRELNELRIAMQSKQISAQSVERNREKILEDFYLRSLKNKSPELHRFIEDKLLTISGFRNSEAFDNALEVPGISEHALLKLVQLRVLRLEERGGVKRIELIHDVMTPVVRKRRDQRLLFEKQQQIEQERLEAEQRDLAAKEALRISRRKTLMYAVLSLIFILTTAFSYWNWMNAKKSREITLSGKLATQATLLAEHAPDDSAIEKAAALSIESWKIIHNTEASTIARKLLRMLPKYRIQHDETVTSVAFGSANNLLATASKDKTVRLINSKNGQEKFRIQHNDRVNSIAFSPNGQHLVTGSKDKIARLIDIANEKVIFEFSHANGVRKVIFSPNNDLIATASKNTVRLINSKTGKELTQLSYAHKVNNIAFSPNSQLLAIASKKGMTSLITISGKKITEIPHKASVNFVAFSPNGQLLATANNDNVARLIDTITGKELKSFKHQGVVWSVEFSPNGLWLATASDDNKARIFEISTGNQVAEISHNKGVYVVKFSPDGQFLATSSQDHTARLIETDSWQEITRIVHGDTVWNIAFSPDSQLLATASSDKLARIIETFTYEGEVKIKQDGAIYGIAFDSKSQFLAIASADETANLYHINTGKKVMTIHHQDEVYGVLFSNNGRFLATSSKDLAVKLIEVATGKEIAQFKHYDEVRNISFSPDSRWLTTASLDKVVKVIDIASAQEITQIINDDEIRSVAFTADNQVFAIASKDGTVKLIDTKTWLTTKTIKLTTGISQIAFSPDGQLLAIAGEDGMARILMVSSGKEKASFKHDKTVLNVAFSPNGKLLATGSEDNTARLINIFTDQLIATIKHGGTVQSLAFSPDGIFLATGSLDGTTRLIETSSGIEVEQISHRDSVWAIAFSPDSKLLASGINNGRVRLTEADPITTFEHLCAKAGRNLNTDEWNRYLPFISYKKTCDNWRNPPLD